MGLQVLEIAKERLGDIREMWEKNREFHSRTSEYFGYCYENLDFDSRMRAFLEMREEDVKISGGYNEDGKLVGYAMSAIEGSKGELITLYIDEEYRRRNLATILCNLHIRWFSEKRCKEIVVHVLNNNKGAIEFYGLMGFQRDILEMRIPLKESSEQL